MGIYHITYTPELKEACLYFGERCNFSCHGCISKYHSEDCHLDGGMKQSKNRTLSREEVISYIKPLFLKRTVFLGLEPTVDTDFLPLAKTIKKQFSTYNILITNGYKYIEDRTIDEVCVSIKAISRKTFKDFTGKDNPEQVLNNFKRYTSIPNLEVRAESIFIPGYIDKDEIEKIARFISSVDSLIPYRIDGYMPYLEKDNFRKPVKSEMEEAKKISEKYLKNVSILHYGVKVKHRVKRIY